MLAKETYWSLMSNWPHWAMELTLMGIFDGIIGALAWPAFKRWVRRHDRDVHKTDG